MEYTKELLDMRPILYASIIVIMMTIILAMVRLHAANTIYLYCQQNGILLLTSFSILFFLRALWRFNKANITHRKTNILVSLAFLAGPITIFLIQSLQILVDNDILDSNQLNSIIYGVILMFLLYTGNYAINAKDDGSIGLRNRWSLSDPIIWAKTQRFFGRFLIVASLITIPFTFFEGKVAIAILILLFAYGFTYIATSIYSIVYHHYLSKERQLS